MKIRISLKEHPRIDGIKFVLSGAKKYSPMDFQPIPFAYRDYLERDGFVIEVLKKSSLTAALIFYCFGRGVMDIREFVTGKILQGRWRFMTIFDILNS